MSTAFKESTSPHGSHRRKHLSRKNAPLQPVTPLPRTDRSLGLNLRDRKRLIERIRKGLPAKTLENLARTLGLPEREVARYVGISARTLARRKTEGRFHPDESNRIAQLAMLFDDVMELFEGNAESAAHWFHTPKKALGGATPIEYADTEPGVREIQDLIGRLEHGIFS